MLKDRYHELINYNNIQSCLEQINELNHFQLDVHGIIADSKVLSCDVTADITGIDLHENLYNVLQSCLTSLIKYQIHKYGNNGYTITKMVKTKNRQLRLSIYNKHNELLKSTNADFLNGLNDKFALLSYFNNKFRIESNIKTLKQLRELLDIDNNELMTVLQANANPLLTVFDTIFEITSNGEIPPFKQDFLFAHESLPDLLDSLLVKECENDIRRLVSVLNYYLSANTNKSKYQKRFLKHMSKDPIPNKHLKTMIQIRDAISHE